MLHVTSLIYRIFDGTLLAGVGVAAFKKSRFSGKRGCNSLFLDFFTENTERLIAVTTVTVVFVTVAYSYCCNGNLIVTVDFKTALLLHLCYKLLHLCYRPCYSLCYILFV